MGWEYFCVVGFDLGPLLQSRTRILHLQYFFKYVLTYSLHLNSYLVTFLHNTICRAQLFCPSVRFRISFEHAVPLPFYCVNTSYPMDNSLSGQRRPARQTSEKDVLCLHRPGRSNAVHSPGGVWYFLPV